jgi:hypothetical protein
VRAHEAVDDSIGILIDARAIATVGSVVNATIIGGNNNRSGPGTNSVGILARRTGGTTLIEDNPISGGPATGDQVGSWAILSDRGTGSVLRNRLNIEANNANLNGPGCTQLTFCGGFRGDSSSMTVKSNIIRGARAELAAGVLLHVGEGAAGELVVNGNTIDAVGDGSDNGSISAAMALRITRGTDAVTGRLRNNILLGGTNAQRFGVYEQKSTKTVHLQVVANNAFWNPPRADATGDLAYNTWNGSVEANYTFAELSQVTTPAPVASVGTDPKLDATFHLTSLSTAVIDKGTLTEAPAHDIDNDSRPKGAGIDIGCDEK